MSEKLTQEDTERRYLEKDILLKSQYKNSKSSNKLECLICKHSWSATLNSLHNGSGCPKCGKLKAAKAKKKTHEQVAQECLNQGILLKEQYKGARGKHKFECVTCQHTWEASIYNIVTNTQSGCTKCKKQKQAEKQKLSQEFIEAEYAKRQIKVLSKYTNNNTHIDLECQVCGHQWKGLYSNLQAGKGCLACAKYGFQVEKPAWLYILKLELPAGVFYKIGITGSKRLKQRIKEIHESAILVSKTYYKLGQDAYKEEQRLHNVYAEHRITLDCVTSGKTEWFTEAILTSAN